MVGARTAPGTRATISTNCIYIANAAKSAGISETGTDDERKAHHNPKGAVTQHDHIGRATPMPSSGPISRYKKKGGIVDCIISVLLPLEMPPSTSVICSTATAPSLLHSLTGYVSGGRSSGVEIFSFRERSTSSIPAMSPTVTSSMSQSMRSDAT